MCVAESGLCPEGFLMPSHFLRKLIATLVEQKSPFPIGSSACDISSQSDSCDSIFFLPLPSAPMTACEDAGRMTHRRGSCTGARGPSLPPAPALALQRAVQPNPAWGNRNLAQLPDPLGKELAVPGG